MPSIPENSRRKKRQEGSKAVYKYGKSSKPSGNGVASFYPRSQNTKAAFCTDTEIEESSMVAIGQTIFFRSVRIWQSRWNKSEPVIQILSFAINSFQAHLQFCSKSSKLSIITKLKIRIIKTANAENSNHSNNNVVKYNISKHTGLKLSIVK